MKRVAPRKRHPSWLAALLFILALGAASIVAAAESAGTLPDKITSMSAAEIEGTAPPDDPSRIARWLSWKWRQARGALRLSQGLLASGWHRRVACGRAHHGGRAA